jgi:uncharacterized membrane protein
MPLLVNDAAVFGLLCVLLGVIVLTSASENSFWKKFYGIVPSILLMYFIPSLLNSFGVISAEKSKIYHVASQYLLPACLVLLTLSIDFKALVLIGKKATLLFFAGTLGVIVGGPVAILAGKVLFPELFSGAEGSMEVWRGFSTIAGSWIGGGANQTAMYEVFKPAPDLFSVMLSVDILVANLWMGAVLFIAGRKEKLDRLFKADTAQLEHVREKTEHWQLSITRPTTTRDFMLLLMAGFGITGLSHVLADVLAPWFSANVSFADEMSLNSTFFWVVVLATTGGMLLAFTPARNLEGVGASRLGSVFIYILVAAIGMKMDVTALVKYPELFVLGIIWMMVHILFVVGVAFFLKAPAFYLAAGSMANIGGAASAPVAASAFHPSLASIGVILAVLGYAVGTYGAYLTALIMKAVS